MNVSSHRTHTGYLYLYFQKGDRNRSMCKVLEKETESIQSCHFPFTLSGRSFNACTSFSVSIIYNYIKTSLK